MNDFVHLSYTKNVSERHFLDGCLEFSWFSVKFVKPYIDQFDVGAPLQIHRLVHGSAVSKQDLNGSR